MRTHAATGRRALFVNPHFTTGFDGMTEAESAPILNHLYDVATKPENIYRHRWRAGDVVMWDNRCTMHYAVADYPGQNDFLGILLQTGSSNDYGRWSSPEFDDAIGAHVALTPARTFTSDRGANIGHGGRRRRYRRQRQRHL